MFNLLCTHHVENTTWTLTTTWNRKNTHEPRKGTSGRELESWNSPAGRYYLHKPEIQDVCNERERWRGWDLTALIMCYTVITVTDLTLSLHTPHQSGTVGSASHHRKAYYEDFQCWRRSKPKLEENIWQLTILITGYTALSQSRRLVARNKPVCAEMASCTTVSSITTLNFEFLKILM